MSISIFDPIYVDSTKQPCFFGRQVNIARYDKQHYPVFDKLSEKQVGFFWSPDEVDLSRDARDFKELTDSERHIFTSNLKRQILLDSVQGRAPVTAFLPICSIPELENWIITWSFFETIHSRSYTHLIQNVYPDPSKVFDDILYIMPIIECAKDISVYYDDLIRLNYTRPKSDPMEHKKALWLALNAVCALEGIRFYVSFACSWAFGELKKMEGNAKIIKFIARDENVHLAAVQHILKILPQEDPDFAQIKEVFEDVVIDLYDQVAAQEKEWAKYLFKDGSLIGLNEQLLCLYIDYITGKRKHAIGLKNSPRITNDPLPWTQKWISGSDVQVAPQEVEISSYIVGGVKQDVDEDSFKGFKL